MRENANQKTTNTDNFYAVQFYDICSSPARFRQKDTWPQFKIKAFKVLKVNNKLSKMIIQITLSSPEHVPSYCVRVFMFKANKNIIGS